MSNCFSTHTTQVGKTTRGNLRQASIPAASVRSGLSTPCPTLMFQSKRFTVFASDTSTNTNANLIQEEEEEEEEEVELEMG